jgi:hypothetical protein
MVIETEQHLFDTGIGWQVKISTMRLIPFPARAPFHTLENFLHRRDLRRQFQPNQERWDELCNIAENWEE